MSQMRKLIVAAMLVLTVTGCNNVSPEVVTLVKVVSTSAHERALFFSMQAKNVTSVAENEAALVKEYVRAHGSGLNLDAKALSDLYRALSIRGKANVFTKSTIKEMHTTSVERAKLFNAMRKHLATSVVADKAEFARWLDAHGDGLTALADSMGAVVKKLDAEKAATK